MHQLIRHVEGRRKTVDNADTGFSSGKNLPNIGVKIDNFEIKKICTMGKIKTQYIEIY